MMMKRFFAAALAALLFASQAAAQGLPFPGPGMPAKPVIATPTSLGSTVLSASARSSATHTTTAAIPAGSLAFVAVFAPFGSAKTISSISDGTNSYSSAVTNAYDGSTQLVAAIYYKENASAVSSSATITVTFSGNTLAQPTVITAGYTTGIITSSSLDKTNSGTTSAGTAYASGSTGTLTQANEIAIGFIGEYNASVTITEGSGFSTLNNPRQGSGSNFNANLAYQIVSATTALNYQPSTSANTYGKVLIATFKGY